jgi:hypothetical protein
VNFELASRKKYRFPSVVGLLSVEDLWDLPLTSKTNKPNLDDIARQLFVDLNGLDKPVSFVSPASDDARKAELTDKFEIVKHIIDNRLAENKAALEAGERAEKKRKLLTLLEQKQDAALGEMSLEEIQKQINAL